MDKQFQGKTNDYIHNLWKHIVSELSKAKDLPTVRLRTTEGKWFSAYSKNESIYIDNSQTNEPSVELNSTRTIDEKEFSEVYPYYQPWRKEEIQRQSVPGQNTSYILALINHFEKDNCTEV